MDCNKIMTVSSHSLAPSKSKNIILQKNYLVRIDLMLEQRSRRAVPMGRGEECNGKLTQEVQKRADLEELVHVRISVVEVGVVVCGGFTET